MKTNTTTFKVDRKRLMVILNELKRLSTSLYSKGNIKIRVLINCIEIYGIGVVKYLSAETDGHYDVYISMKLFYDFAKNSKSEILTFTFNDGELRCGSSIYSLSSIKLEKVDWNEDLDLQINYDEYSLIYEFLNNGMGFIEKHKLELKLEKANSNLNTSINKAFELLKFYKINKEDLKKFVIEQIKKKKLN
jgi:hypothetical protein